MSTHIEYQLLTKKKIITILEKLSDSNFKKSWKKDQLVEALQTHQTQKVLQKMLKADIENIAKSMDISVRDRNKSELISAIAQSNQTENTSQEESQSSNDVTEDQSVGGSADGSVQSEQLKKFMSDCLSLFSKNRLREILLSCSVSTIAKSASKQKYIDALINCSFMGVVDQWRLDEIDMVYRAEIEDFETYIEEEFYADTYARLKEIVLKMVDYYHTGSLSNNDKVLMLLANDDVETQLQGVSIFESLSQEQQREITAQCFQEEGRNPYLISIEEFENDEYCSAPQVIERCSFFPPNKYRYTDLYLYVDWMMAVAQDPRWLSAKKLHVQYMIATEQFPQEMVGELLAHLLHHPNLKELYLMEGSLNAIGLLDDLTKAGAKGETVEETLGLLYKISKVTTNYLHHPFLTDLSIQELTLLGEDLPFQYVHFANVYNKYTLQSYNAYWGKLEHLSFDVDSFSNVRSLTLDGCANCLSVYIGDHFHDIQITNCSELGRISSSCLLQSVHIDKCPNLYSIDMPKPNAFHLGHDLKNGLGCAVAGSNKNWEKQFEQLLSQQRQEICVEALHVSAEGNQYFWFNQTHLTNYIFSLSWVFERLTEYFQNQTDFIIDGDGHSFSSDDFYEPDSEYSDLESISGISAYTGFDELPNESHKHQNQETSVLHHPIPSKGLSADIIDELSSYFSLTLDISEFCGGGISAIDSYNIWEGIFSSIEKTAFTKWVQTLPKEMAKEITKITK